MNNKTNKKIQSFALAGVVAIIFVTVATVLGELYSPFKDWLKETFNHHWIGKGVIAIVIFYVLGLFNFHISDDSEDKMVSILRILYWVAFIGVLVITGFYLYEAFLVTHA